MALPTASDNEFPKVIMEEVANDGSATTTPAADHRALFLGEDGALHLKDSAAAVTTIGGVSAGTAFPGSPATDALFHRTDHDLIYTYDGTRWVTVNQYTMHVTTRTLTGLTTTSNMGTMPTLGSTADMWVEGFRCHTFVASTNSGTHYWTLELKKIEANNTKTTIGSIATNADTVNTWTVHLDTINEVVAGATYIALEVQATVTGSPGALFPGFEVTYRRIAT